MSETHDATRRKLVIASTAGLVLASASGLALVAEKGGGRGQEKEVGAVERFDA